MSEILDEFGDDYGRLGRVGRLVTGLRVSASDTTNARLIVPGRTTFTDESLGRLVGDDEASGTASDGLCVSTEPERHTRDLDKRPPFGIGTGEIAESKSDAAGGFPLPSYMRAQLGYDEYGGTITPLSEGR